MDQVYRVNFQINNVFLTRIKARILRTLRSKEKKLFKKQTTQVKGQKRIVYPMQKIIIQKKPPPFKNKEDYICDTNEKTRGYDDSTSATYGCVRNLGGEY